MRMCRQVLVMLGAGVLAAGFSAALQVSAADAAAGARPATTAGGWGKAITLRGPAGWAGVASPALSCPSPGNCGAGGTFLDAGHPEAYLVSQVRGTWGKVIKVPGLARLNKYHYAAVNSVSCATPGNCSAGGEYKDGTRNGQAFVVSQVHGTWHTAIEVPGFGRLNKGDSLGLGGITCPSAGNCSATGTYILKSGEDLPFVVSQVHGIWRNAATVPGIAALPGVFMGSRSVYAWSGPAISCASAGNCTAAGSYPVAGGNQVYVVSQVHGVWSRAIQIPGTAALNTGLAAAVTISCPSLGNCGAGGSYTTSDGLPEAFVVSQVHGTWGRAIEVPGTPRLNMGAGAGAGAGVSSISCPSAGNCSAGGIYAWSPNGDKSTGQVFVVSEVNGTWYRAMPVPGAVRLNKGDNAGVSSISCPRAGNCSAGGYYTPGGGNDGFPYNEAFVVSEVHGTWGRALEVPGTSAKNTGKLAGVTVVSCAAPGKCTAAGGFLTATNGFGAFVVSKS